MSNLQTYDDKIGHLLERRSVLILYIDECRKKEDWHGVRDAATDIEVCQAELGVYQDLRVGRRNPMLEAGGNVRSVSESSRFVKDAD